MMTAMTFAHAAVSVSGGALGARLTRSPIGSGIVAVAAGFVALVTAQLLGAGLVVSSLISLAVTVGAALALRLTGRQVAGVVLGSFAASFAVAFVFGFLHGFENGFERALHHRAGPAAVTAPPAAQS
ncbi:MAG: hypothetical protein PGN34_19040 [Methylobacterium frigidaeris]